MTGTDRADLARAIARAVVAVPGVTRLVGDARPVEVATLHRGGKVVGVRLAERAVSVHVAVDSLPLQEVTAAIGRAIRHVLDEAADDREIAVVIDRLDGVERLPGHDSGSVPGSGSGSGSASASGSGSASASGSGSGSGSAREMGR